MIVIPSKQIAIITPPKCGSTSLHSMLCTERHSGIYVCGPQLDGQIDKHTLRVPYIALGFRIAVVVRDPYERALSLWSHHQYHNHNRRMPIEQWITSELLSNPFNQSIADLVASANLAQYHYWKLEYIHQCLRSIGITETLPKENVGQHPPITPDVRASLRDWAWDDCRLFEYHSPAPPTCGLA